MKQDEKLNYIKELNNSLSPLSKYIKFGWDDNSEILYITVMDSKSNEIIRRFPEEEAKKILTKVQDIKGFFIDDKA